MSQTFVGAYVYAICLIFCGTLGVSYVQGSSKLLTLFTIIANRGLKYIQRHVETLNGENEADPSAKCSLDVAALSEDDGLEARAEALACPYDEGHLDVMWAIAQYWLEDKFAIGIVGSLIAWFTR